MNNKWTFFTKTQFIGRSWPTPSVFPLLSHWVVSGHKKSENSLRFGEKIKLKLNSIDFLTGVKNIAINIKHGSRSCTSQWIVIECLYKYQNIEITMRTQKFDTTISSMYTVQYKVSAYYNLKIYFLFSVYLCPRCRLLST